MITRHLLTLVSVGLIAAVCGQTIVHHHKRESLLVDNGDRSSVRSAVSADRFVENFGVKDEVGPAGWGGSGLEAEAGSAAEIPCDLPADVTGDGVIIVWKHESRILFAGSLRVRQDPRLTIRGNGRILVVAGVEPRDAGEYTCQAELENRELATAVRRLVVLQPARAKIAPSSGGGVITVKAGTSLLLSCSGSGVPVPEVAWLRDGQVLAAATSEVNLPLKSIGWQAGGLYQCRAANSVGEPHVQNYTIHVLHAPVVEILPVDVEQVTEKGEEERCRVQIQCLVYANPRAAVRWFHNGRLLQPEAASSGIAIWSLEYLQVLQLPDCDAEREGEYRCVADNNLGSDEAATRLESRHISRVVAAAAAEELIVRVDRQISLPTSGSGQTASSWPAVVLLLLSLLLRTVTTK